MDLLVDVMTASGTAGRAPVRWRDRLAVPIALVVIGVLGGVVGWFLNDDSSPKRAVRVSETFTGTVGVVNQSGTAGCVKPDGREHSVCSIFFVPVGGHVHSGEHVRAAHEWVTIGDSGYDLLFVYPTTVP